MLTVLILDPATRAVLTVLPEAVSVTYARRPRTATEITVTVARDAPGLAHATRGRLLEVWRGTTLEASGRLELRDVTRSTVTLTAYTEEIVLKDYVTPDAYGAALSGRDAADVIRACLDRWHTIRLKAAADWQAGGSVANLAMTNVQAVDAGNGTLWLTRNGSGQYERAGYVRLTFDADTIPGFTGWERVRWASDYPPDGLVYTTLQYALSNSATLPGESSTSWLPNVSWQSPSTNPQTLKGERGVLPDEIGLELGGATERYLHVICRLYSDDQTSQEEGEVDTSGSSPRWYALEVVARTGGPIQAGSIPASTGVTVQALQADNAPAFDVIRAACEQAELDFQVLAGALNVAESFGGEDGLHLITSEGLTVRVTDTQEAYAILTTDDGVPVHDEAGRYFVIPKGA